MFVLSCVDNSRKLIDVRSVLAKIVCEETPTQNLINNKFFICSKCLNVLSEFNLESKSNHTKDSGNWISFTSERPVNCKSKYCMRLYRCSWYFMSCASVAGCATTPYTNEFGNVALVAMIFDNQMSRINVGAIENIKEVTGHSSILIPPLPPNELFFVTMWSVAAN